MSECGFNIGAGWSSAVCLEPEPCPKHGDYKCSVCGAQPAKYACSHAGQFVCGFPLCEEHKDGWCSRNHLW